MVCACWFRQRRREVRSMWFVLNRSDILIRMVLKNKISNWWLDSHLWWTSRNWIGFNDHKPLNLIVEIQKRKTLRENERTHITFRFWLEILHLWDFLYVNWFSIGCDEESRPWRFYNSSIAFRHGLADTGQLPIGYRSIDRSIVWSHREQEKRKL